MPENKLTHIDLFSGIPSGDSPSPPAGQDSGQSPSAKKMSGVKKSLPRTSGPKLWPTPSVCGNYNQKGASKTSGDGLATAIKLPSTPTSEPSPAISTVAQPCLLAGFPVSPSVVPGSDEARKMTASSGRQWLPLLQAQGPLGSLAKMLLESSRWNSTVVFLAWRGSATPCGRSLFQLVPSEPSTDEAGYGLWRTPGATDGEGGVMEMRPGTTGKYKLRDHVQPINAKMWPTPCERDHHPNGMAIGSKVDLGNQVKMFPTPKERDWKGQTQRGIHAQQDALPNMDKGDGKPIGGSLNPRWVCWLMGYPLDWLDGVSGPKNQKKSRVSQLESKTE